MKDPRFTLDSPEVARTLLQAGLWATTGKLFPIDRASLLPSSSGTFREALLERAIREKMMPMLDVFSRAHNLGLGSVPGQLSEVFRIIAREQYVHLRPILNELAGQGVPIVLIKGADLDLAVYEKRFPRVMGDIDVLVHPRDVRAVLESFGRRGFLQGKLDKSLSKIVPLTDLEREETEEGSIELAELSKLIDVPELLAFEGIIQEHLSYWRMMPLDGSFHLVIGYDVHIHLSLDFELEDVWSDLRTIDFPEVGTCLAQSFTDVAWYLAARFYHELHLNDAFIMRAFLDVLSVLHRHNDEIDWKKIGRVARKYRLSPALYYVFWHAHELGFFVPGEILDSLCPSRTEVGRGHDWGDFVPRMLGQVQITDILSG